MADIVLTTLNARYAHAAFGLRYLMANLADLSDRAVLLEFDINQRPADVLEVILSHDPKIVGIGVYIWNVMPATQLVAALRRVRPQVTIVLGGPEVSYETNEQEIVGYADFVITGEADLAFAALCRQLLADRRPLLKVIPAELPEFGPGRGEGEETAMEVATERQSDEATEGEEKATKGAEGEAATEQSSRATRREPLILFPSPSSVAPSLRRSAASRHLSLPYHLYTDEDLAHRVLYVEASRGCPFKCEFCLSSLDVPVRNVPLDGFLAAMQRLLDRGARQFKFVDRTFNLNLKVSQAILRFFLDLYVPGLFLHFEMIPDRLPEALRELIRAFPRGALQFEVGVQSLNDEVCRRISRRQSVDRLADNLRFLREETGVHVHADLIVGLPGEDIESFGAGFDRLVGMGPQEIQVGILKRLRGTPIVRHDAEWAMIYSPHPPYEILQTGHMDFATIQRMRRFARYWDLVANSGNFIQTTPLLWQGLLNSTDFSPFRGFLRVTDWLHEQIGRSHAISLERLAQLLFAYLTQQKRIDSQAAAVAIWCDYRQGGRRDGPDFLSRHVPATLLKETRRAIPPHPLPPRQARHDSAAGPRR